MQTSSTMPTTPEKKKLPGWAKLLIGLAIFGVVVSVVAGVALSLVGHYLIKGGGKKLAETAVEKMIESGLKRSGNDVDVKFEKNGVVIRGQGAEKGSEARLGLDGIVIKDGKSGEQ